MSEKNEREGRGNVESTRQCNCNGKKVRQEAWQGKAFYIRISYGMEEERKIMEDSNNIWNNIEIDVIVNENRVIKDRTFVEGDR